MLKPIIFKLKLAIFHVKIDNSHFKIDNFHGKIGNFHVKIGLFHILHSTLFRQYCLLFPRFQCIIKVSLDNLFAEAAFPQG